MMEKDGHYGPMRAEDWMFETLKMVGSRRTWC